MTVEGRRRVRLGVALAGAAVLVAGCGSSAMGSGHPGPASIGTGIVSGTPTTAPGVTAPTAAPTTAAPAGGEGAGTTTTTTAAGGAVGSGTAAALGWPTYDRTAARGGLSVTTPAPGRIHRSWTAHLDGAVYTQPLIYGGRVFVATEDDSVYALAEGSGRVLWRRHLATPVTSGLPCGDINPSGITGTPVIDTATGRLYVVTVSAVPSFHHTLWTLATATGRVVASRGIDVAGSQPAAQQQRSALAILGSRVYVAYGGLYGDCSNYRGRVIGAPLSGSGPTVSFSTVDANRAGIWEPPGPSVAAGSLYVATGNGLPPAQAGQSDSVLRLSPTLGLAGRFTPSDYAYLSQDDRDLGTTSPVPLPDGQVFMIGKQGVAYVLGASRLGGTGGALASHPLCSGAFGGDAVDGETVVVSCFQGLFTARVDPGGPGRAPTITPGWSVTGIAPGPPIIAGGVVWDVTRQAGLIGYRLSTGRAVYRSALDPVVTSFPSLSASGDRLFVPEGAAVLALVGV